MWVGGIGSLIRELDAGSQAQCKTQGICLF